jgi:hypothetical protein
LWGIFRRGRSTLYIVAEPTLRTVSEVAGKGRPAEKRTARRRSESIKSLRYAARMDCFCSFLVVAETASLARAKERRVAGGMGDSMQ